MGSRMSKNGVMVKEIWLSEDSGDWILKLMFYIDYNSGEKDILNKELILNLWYNLNRGQVITRDWKHHFNFN
jgi:hypothetical protein